MTILLAIVLTLAALIILSAANDDTPDNHAHRSKCAELQAEIDRLRGKTW